MRRLSLLLLSLVCLYASTPIPAPSQAHPILLRGGHIFPIHGPDFIGELLFDKGKIVALGNNLTIPEGTEVINIEGLRVYPGLIAASTTMGLVEINAVRATRDVQEVGRLNPNVRAERAYNPDSELLPVARSNGILLAHVIPQGSGMAGLSAVMMLDGWTWESCTLKAPVGLHIHWPRVTIPDNPLKPGQTKKARENRDKTLKSFTEAVENARAYLKARRAGEQQVKDARWEAMLPVVEGKLPVFIHAQELGQIKSAVLWAEEQDLKPVIVGGADAWRLTDFLKSHQVPVIYENVLNLPLRPDEPYDLRFAAPAKLYRAGVKFCIAASSNTFEAPHQRNVPYEAAMAMAFGLPPEEALRSITLSAAEILGVANRVGSLEVGKDATLIVTDGDILQIPTHVKMAFIQGRKVDLNDRHKQLYQKYKTKYQQLGIIK